MIVGVDPGVGGAIALLNDDGSLLTAWDMPVLDGRVSPHLLSTAEGWQDDWTVVLETISTRPGQGGQQGIKMGTNYGVLIGVFGTLGMRIVETRPQVWKKAMRLSADKSASRATAINRWPAHTNLFARVKDDGRAEAALIAEWWRTQS